MKEFVINHFLTLKLEEGKTNIYVNGKLFDQCKFLLLNIPIEDTEKYDKIESIDEAADILGWTYDGQEGVEYNIDPDTEFWGHCSNLQMWYEQEYDTRLLHRNLAFWLLEKLTDAGDPLASRVFKDEISKRFESGYPTVITFILDSGILNCLNLEERKQLLLYNFPDIVKSIEKTPEKAKHLIFNKLLEVSLGDGLIKDQFPAILKSIKKIPDEWKYDAVEKLIRASIKSGLIEEHFHAFLKAINEVLSVLLLKEPSEAGDHIIMRVFKEEIAKHFGSGYPTIIPYIFNAGLFNYLNRRSKQFTEQSFPVILESIEKLPGYANSEFINRLIRGRKVTKLIKVYLRAILKLFLEDISKYPSVIRNLNRQRYLRYLNKDEFYLLFSKILTGQFSKKECIERVTFIRELNFKSKLLSKKIVEFLVKNEDQLFSYGSLFTYLEGGLYLNILFSVVFKFLKYKQIFAYLDRISYELYEHDENNAINFYDSICKLILRHKNSPITINYLEKHIYSLVPSLLDRQFIQDKDLKMVLCDILKNFVGWTYSVEPYYDQQLSLDKLEKLKNLFGTVIVFNPDEYTKIDSFLKLNKEPFTNEEKMTKKIEFILRIIGYKEEKDENKKYKTQPITKWIS